MTHYAARYRHLLAESLAADIVPCPEPGCTYSASVTNRVTHASTDGPVVMGRVTCVSGEHWFVMPLDRVEVAR